MFAASPDGPAALGGVMLGGGSAYDARLEITADGTTLECTKRVGGSAI
jgi:hypothetical protein